MHISIEIAVHVCVCEREIEFVCERAHLIYIHESRGILLRVCGL